VITILIMLQMKKYLFLEKNCPCIRPCVRERDIDRKMWIVLYLLGLIWERRIRPDAAARPALGPALGLQTTPGGGGGLNEHYPEKL
jgi:hypothetical protein